MAEPVTLSCTDGLATLCLDREHGNAINDTLVDGLMAACRHVEADDSIRGVLLTARGKIFCPGLDLQELIELDRSGMEHFARRFGASVLALYTLSKPLPKGQLKVNLTMASTV